MTKALTITSCCSTKTQIDVVLCGLVATKVYRCHLLTTDCI